MTDRGGTAVAFALTEEQRRAVEDRGGALLVSAAAGSGKTRVLVERLLDHVEREGADIDRFLVITYTRAAAGELRERIARELAERSALRPEDRHLRRQLTLVYQTQISTVHAFCTQILREFGHYLDLDSDFTLCDESEGNLLALSALDDVLEARYEDLTPEGDFAALVDTMAAGRDDSRLVRIAQDIRARVQSHPEPERWLAEQAQAYDVAAASDAGDTPWGRLLLDDAARQTEYWRSRLEQAAELARADANLEANYRVSLLETASALRTFRTALDRGWDAARAELPIPFPTAGRKKMIECPGAAAQVKAVRAKAKKRLDKLAEQFEDSSADLLADMAATLPAIRGLFALVRDFDAAYAAEKKRRGKLDFSDLEHFALRLLSGRPEVAAQISGRFDEVMVDEYQDTNEVQNAIFTAVSDGGRRLFMVGDVKQSIYRFRLADPTIFLEKYRSFRPAETAEPGEARRIILSRNFRSRPEVLEGVNDFFRATMSREMGEMDYTDDEALYPGASFPEGEDCDTELYAIDLAAGEAGGEPVAKDLQEARFAARRLRELLDGGFRVSDGGGGMRPMAPEDAAILLRSPGGQLHYYARALDEQDIPWQAEGGGDFFAANEVQVALALLQIVDNPRQDVPLIAALRSPVYGFSADRLAQLRSARREGDFYGALCLGEERGEEDCAAFLGELRKLRSAAVDESCYAFLWNLYDRTDLIGLYGALPGGESRQGNLLVLAELARSFEAGGHKGLFGFLSYLSRLRENGVSVTPPSAARSGGGVRLLSIHRSKGLEFPVVLLCGLMRRLNREDMRQPILFHPKLGVGPKRLELERMIERPTLARRAVARQLEREMMAEELRLLYVAMTRAREKLIMTCALGRGARELESLAVDAAIPAEPQALLDSESVGQWVLLHALARPEGEALRWAAGGGEAEGRFLPGSRWKIALAGPEGTISCRAAGPEPPEAPRCGEADQALLKRLSWEYPFREQVDLPSKLTATQMKGRRLDEEVEAEAPPVRGTRAFRAPRFAQEEFGLTPAEQGTALHLLMQFIDFDRADTEAGVREEIRRLVRMQFLTPQQGEAIRPEKVTAFFRSALGREVLASPTLRREFKFSILVPAEEYFPGRGGGEEILLQGVVDCCFETFQGITVIDFKTDRVTEATVSARAEEYRGQIQVYSRALSVLTGRPVARKVLWFFALNRAVEL